MYLDLSLPRDSDDDEEEEDPDDLDELELLESEENDSLLLLFERLFLLCHNIGYFLRDSLED